MRPSSPSGYGGESTAPKKARDPATGHIALALVLIVFGASVAYIAVAETDRPATPVSTIDAEAVLDTLLLCTVPETGYTDSTGNTMVFQGLTVADILIVDMLHRYQAADLNESSLAEGIEAEIKDLLDDITGSHHFRLTSIFRGTYLKITDLDLIGGERAERTLGAGELEGDIRIALELT